ncbi:hypothetical protein D0T49_01910 [Paludibacter sp. 221]|uniref:DUF6712 family protein n=1 Tax=Paludibacter sp. 221 TaxID=2302939 RepID=UPI0013D636D1|nr:DUF6712 family protein [Paludibacter sp. 221]NDV45805.1 hypothetical protein [Paludibacter sp. 221]
MIKVPFNPENFASEMKPKISGNNLSLEYFNIESSLYKVAVQIPKTISQALYNRLIDKFEAGNIQEHDKTAIDYLQRAMLHFTIYEHEVYLMLRISNDGITTKKNEDETTAFKYQTDMLNDNLITTAWFWMNQLIQYLNDHLYDFPEWKNSDQKKENDELPVNLTDFNKWVGVETTGGEYFMIYAGWIIREVWLDFVKSRFKEPVKTDAITRAVCYQVMGFACQRLAYSCLPSPIRRDIDNEMGKNHKAQADKDIREHVAGKFLQKAETYWKAVDLEIKKEAIAEQNKTAADKPALGRNNITEDDKFYYS